MTTWVLLRGLMREARHWGEFPALFKNTVGAQQVAAPDLPGNGRMYAQSSPTSVAEMAQYCRAQLGQQGYAPPYSLFGLSLGGMVATAWSECYPAELERLVLINTSMAPYNPFYRRLRPKNYPALIRRLLFGSAAQRESLILRLTSNLKSREEQQAILQLWTSYSRECPVTYANILRQLLAAANYRAASAAPSAPVLLLASRQDALVDAQCSISLAQHWHCGIRLHPTAGHDLPLDDGEWVMRQVREWMG